MLRRKELVDALTPIVHMRPRQVINPLFGLLYHGDALVRWRAVSAMGAVTAQLAGDHMESARVIMRRLMWNLNDESGGIGWGAPEAMGEIMARSKPLAREYNHILCAYLNPEGNFLEHQGLQSGVLWGVGRLAQVHPELAADTIPFLLPFLAASTAFLRGLAAWAAGWLRQPDFNQPLYALCNDPASIELYLPEGRLVTRTIAQLATEALSSKE